MTSTAHALVGGAIAVHFHDPVLALPIAVVSHYVMDSIPHWDFGTNWRNRPKQTTGMYAITETLFGMTFAYLIFRPYVAAPLLGATIIASLLPDWLETPWYIFYADAAKHGPKKNAGILERLAYLFYKIPNVFHAKALLPTGLITQIAAVAFFLIILGK